MHMQTRRLAAVLITVALPNGSGPGRWRADL